MLISNTVFKYSFPLIYKISIINVTDNFENKDLFIIINLLLMNTN